MPQKRNSYEAVMNGSCKVTHHNRNGTTKTKHTSCQLQPENRDATAAMSVTVARQLCANVIDSREAAG
jgi:hypothetical protein